MDIRKGTVKYSYHFAHYLGVSGPTDLNREMQISQEKQQKEARRQKDDKKKR